MVCVSLCPPTFVQCNANEVKIETSRKIANSDCQCPEWKCMQAKQQKGKQAEKANASSVHLLALLITRHFSNYMSVFVSCVAQVHIPVLTIQQCSEDGKTYRPGDWFISSDCSGSCQCLAGGNVGCVSLCPPVQVKCLPNEEQIKSLRKIPNSNCTCPYFQCVKRKAKG